MPRGRHRHSQPLHRMLPPLTVAGTAAVLALASLICADTALVRVLAVAAALVAGAGAALARVWDRSAGREVGELTARQVRDERKAEEREAELETDLEESREIRGRLEKKLRAKRAELGRLRTEHADLLRRYATAETERARALEARRRVQREGAAAGRLALGTGPAPVGPAAYLKAADALRNLARNAATQQARRTVEEARRRDAAPDGRQARHAWGAPVPRPGEPRTAPTASAVLPYAQPTRPNATASRAIGGFDFFGSGTGLKPAPPQGLAPVGPVVQHPAAPVEHAQASEVIDLTAHDETEQLDVRDLRAQA
ncbi:hypothetical protein [Actinacidiphila yeochonensis]|uniref:hypothetical protein n=1 Tax=Actinacidiphila yeochonensis TaxID=89050 RepID=UPI00056B3A07|nr:hypothetical protein [Actinacidiphila yeochonensis]